MSNILETEQLLLREFTLDDTKFVIELLNSPGWLEFIGDRNVKTEEQAKNYLQSGPLKSYKENGFGLALVATKKDQTPVGMCGLIKRDNLEGPDIGFAFLPEFTGKGYAFEIAKATITFATEQLKLSTILAITNSNNNRSIKLLEKIGMKFMKMLKFHNDGIELMLFSHQ